MFHYLASSSSWPLSSTSHSTCITCNKAASYCKLLLSLAYHDLSPVIATRQLASQNFIRHTSQVSRLKPFSSRPTSTCEIWIKLLTDRSICVYLYLSYKFCLLCPTILNLAILFHTLSDVSSSIATGAPIESFANCADSPVQFH